MIKNACLGVAASTVGLLASGALAAPRESVTFTNVLSEAADGAVANQTRQHTFTGGYPVGSVRVTATLAEIATGTYGTEARIRLSPPGGSPFVIRPFSIANFDGSISLTNFQVRADPSVAVSAGQWNFQFFESYVDSATGPDANWDSVQLTLDDEVIVVPGNLPTTAKVPQGTGPLTSVSGELFLDGPAQLFKIRICEPTNFSASTVGGTGVDTQLYLFNANGVGVAYNDQVDGGNQSRITNQFTATLAPGDFFIGISEWDVPAQDSAGSRLWEDEPWDLERAPDGPGAANPVAAWGTDFGAGGSYTIALTGACYVGPANNCVADVDDGSGNGVQDGAVTIDDLLYYLVAFEDGIADADVDNGTFTGTQDNAVTIDDLLYYVVRFEDGC
jgi:hypothetical protein